MSARKYTYPWRTRNEFSLLATGKNFYPDILTEISNSTSSIYIIQYLVASGVITSKIIDAIIQAANRDVNVYIILDAYGSSELSEFDRDRLTQNKVNIISFNPFSFNKLLKFLYRDHRKLIIIDDTIAYTGGAGFTDEFDTAQNPDEGWQDIMVKIRGEILADCHHLFTESWRQLSTGQLPVYRVSTPVDLPHAGRVNVAYKGTQEVVRSITRHMQRAQNRIVFITPYFVTTWKIRRHLRKASNRGAEVLLVVPGARSDHPWINHISRHYYTRLLKNNIKIYEYQPRFLHTKLILCDDWANIGSSNLDRWNMRFNHDANIEIRGAEIIDQINLYIEELVQDSTLINATQWHQRPLSERLKVWFWSKIALWIERLTQYSP